MSSNSDLIAELAEEYARALSTNDMSYSSLDRTSHSTQSRISWATMSSRPTLSRR